MNKDKRARILTVLRDIRDDAEADATALDGKPFDGRTVAEQFGNVLASVAALSRIVEAIVPEATDDD